MLRGLFRPVSAVRGLQTERLFGSCNAAPVLSTRIRDLRNAIINSNWSDVVQSMQNVPHWETEYAALSYDMNMSSPAAAVKTEFENLGKLFDLYYAAEDVRDHISEVSEVKSRSGGIAGVGINASEPIDNLDEHALAAVAAYENMLKNYPDYKVKIEQGVGFAISNLRSKHKFRYSNQYRHYF